MVTLGWCLFVYGGGVKLFRDSDSGWHIRHGERMLRTGGIARTDPYSFSRAGEPWFAWEWGADLAMGAAHRWYGLAGVAALYAALLALCSWLWFGLHWKLEGDFLVACVLAALMLSTVNLHWLARPHVLGWLGLLAVLRMLESAGGRLTAARSAGWLALGAAWANLHASFALGLVVILAFAAGRAAGRFLWVGGAAAVTPVLWAAALFAAGTLLNPFGWNLHGHVAAYLANPELLDRVAEFQTFNFRAAGALPIALTLGMGFAAAVTSLAARRPDHAAVALGLSLLGLMSARGLPLVALAALPLFNASLTRLLKTASGLRPWLTGALAYSGRLRAIDSRQGGTAFAAAASLALLAVFCSPAVAARAGFPPGEFPVAESESVAALPGQARIFAPDKFGGYLIYRFDGARPVFFDGRSDFYGLDFMKRYIRMVEMRPGWRKDFDAWNFTHALVPPQWALRAALEESGWKAIRSGPAAVLLERPRAAGTQP